MFFLTYELKGKQVVGLLTVDQKQVIPLVAAEKHYYKNAILPDTMVAIINDGENALQRIKKLAEKVANDKKCRILLLLKDVRIKAPIPRLAKNIFCIGRNYAEHATERDKGGDPNKLIPKYPIFFTKPPTAVIGPNELIKSHKQITDALDYEAELAVVIGEKAYYVSKEEAMNYVFGYTIFNDVTARDLQELHHQWFRGKALDASAPMGPYLVHKSAVHNPGNLAISLTVNGELRQSSNTQKMIFDIPTLINTISAGITLEPGDVIATGTPEGVGQYFKPPKFLHSGDKVAVTISGLGTLENVVE